VTNHFLGVKIDRIGAKVPSKNVSKRAFSDVMEIKKISIITITCLVPLSHSSGYLKKNAGQPVVNNSG
jgi:hypothetical protein